LEWTDIMRSNTRCLVVLLLGGAVSVLAGCGRQPVVVLNPDGVALAKGADNGKDGDSPKGVAGGGEGFRFPGDPGGKHLGTLLPPRENFRLPPESPSGPRPHPALPALENPTLPPPLGQAALPRLSAEKASRPARPGPLPEDTPLLSYYGTPPQPHEPALTPGVLAKAPSPSVGRPVPPPVLGQPVPDPAPLDDPTTDASLAAALAAPMPSRTNPAPFLKLTLPDPFENRETGRLRGTPPEDGSPVAATPQLPK
jgi:hypothetical protein